MVAPFSLPSHHESTPNTRPIHPSPVHFLATNCTIFNLCCGIVFDLVDLGFD